MTDTGTAPNETATVRHRIVVGIDGSVGSDSALKWARREATLRDGTVELVHGWLGSAASLDETGYAIAACEQSGEAVLAQALAGEKREAPDLVVTTLLVASSPAQALIDASQGADLVVVGSRGHGGFAGLLLGSVSAALTHHAHCPVVIVR